MQTQKYPLSPPDLGELAEKLKAPLSANFEHASVEVVRCPDLRNAPFDLATEGLSGEERIADVGGQFNLFPRPRLDSTWSMTEIAKAMGMSPEKGSLIGAGAGPFHVLGQNTELAPSLGWKGAFDKVVNQTRYAQINKGGGEISVRKTPSVDCGLMANLYGSLGEPGPVLKITARKTKGPEKSFTECIRQALHAAYGDSQTVSLGGVFLIKTGKTHFHVMPDFPSEQELPFTSREHVNEWLSWHDFKEPIVCLSVLHSADPGEKMGLRMEHSHGFSVSGGNAGGHYHYDAGDGDEDVEYEAYFNTAQAIYRVDQPAPLGA